MSIRITTDPAEFRSRAESFLLRDPLRHTVILTVLANLLTGIDTGAARFLTVHAADDEVVGVAMRTARHDAYLGELPPGSVPAVAEALAAEVPENSGVEAVVADAEAFARHWGALRGCGFHRTVVVRLYRLDALCVPDVPGKARQAVDSDVALCLDWTSAMRAEVGMPQVEEAALRRRVRAGHWWLWERDGEPVSLAAHQIPVHGWARIGPVYTPPGARGHGYASAATAHVSKLLREEGADVCLFADLDNPTSNRIYQAIGFRATDDFAHFAFG